MSNVSTDMAESEETTEEYDFEGDANEKDYDNGEYDQNDEAFENYNEYENNEEYDTNDQIEN